MDISGRTKLVALLGHPLDHSLFPSLINGIFQKLELPFALLPFDLDETAFKGAVPAARTLKMAGLLFARPYKETAASLLDEIGPTSRIVGSVDTAAPLHGKWVGHNTEVWASLAALKEAGCDSLEGKRALILGAGGTARAIMGGLLWSGASALRIGNRSEAKGRAVADHFRARFPRAVIETLPLEPREVRPRLAQTDILVNATPSDLQTPQGPLLSERDLHPALVVFDANYTRLTPLLMEAKRMGCTAVSGARMLLWQTSYSVKEWTGRAPPVDKLEEALSSALGLGPGAVARPAPVA